MDQRRWKLGHGVGSEGGSRGAGRQHAVAGVSTSMMVKQRKLQLW
jgi:hypothetical protein